VPERVLITGATGFVGSHIAEAFYEAGYEVRCSVRASSDIRWIEALPVKLVPLDLDQPEKLARVTEDARIVVHAAGITRACRTDDYHRINAEGTRRLAATAAKTGVHRFILIGSLSAHGPDTLSKDGRDRPVSPYGQSKLEAETHLRSFTGQMETVVLRPAAVYGPRDTDMLLLFKMARSGWLIFPPGPGLLQPVYAEDVARAALAAAVKKETSFGPFPVAEATQYSWQDVVRGLEWTLGRSIRTVHLPVAFFRLAGRASEWTAKFRGSAPVFDERRARDLALYSWACDPSDTENKLGWRAEVPLYEGLQRTARWYREVGWL
jgi:nucleoside-diphosphate-sugar epimerase